MSLETTVNQGGPAVVALAAVLLLLALLTVFASIYTAWLLAGLLVTGLLKQLFVALGIIGLASANAAS